MNNLPRMMAAAARNVVFSGVLVSVVAGCGAPAPRSRADIGAQADCRARADDSYNRQNRSAIYQADNYDTSLKDAPFATSGLKGLPTRGLSDQYARDNMMQACLAGIGRAPDTAIEATPGAVVGVPK